MDLGKNIHIIARVRIDYAPLMLEISSVVGPTLISIYADNAAAISPSPSSCICLPTCNAFPFKEWGAAPSCVTFCKGEKGASTCQSRAGKWNGEGHIWPRSRPSIGCCCLRGASRSMRARETNEVFAQSANRPSVRPCVVLARWMDQDNREGGRKSRPRG